MERQQIIHSSLTVKLLIIGASIITTFITFFTETKPILANDITTFSSKPTFANDSFHEILVREDNPSTPTEEISDWQFSTNTSDLLANPHNERLNIDFSRYVNIEIGERGCDVASGLATFFASVFYSVSLPNTPANTITISVTTPTRGRQTVKLESEEGAAPESQKTCDEIINKTIEIDRKLRILQRHKPVRHSELELTIQNAWDILNY